MKKNQLYLVIFLLMATKALWAASDTHGVHISQQPEERFLAENRNLIGEDFWASYRGQDAAQRHLAEMYLSGVLDATEGKAWCSYRVASPEAIEEQIYLGFKKASAATLKKRTSEIVQEILSAILPCRNAK